MAAEGRVGSLTEVDVGERNTDPEAALLVHFLMAIQRQGEGAVGRPGQRGGP